MLLPLVDCLWCVWAGYGDMYALIRSMVAANYNGSIILDHTPSFEEFAGTEER